MPLIEVCGCVRWSIFPERFCTRPCMPWLAESLMHNRAISQFSHVALWMAVMLWVRLLFVTLPVTLAPLLLLPIGYYIDKLLLPLLPATLGNYFLYVLLQTIIIENAVPSVQDMRIAGHDWLGVILYLVLFGALFLSWLGVY